MDRIRVKDRIESKPRLGSGKGHPQFGWIVSVSKIALRANHDFGVGRRVKRKLDRIRVKDRIESKPRLVPRVELRNEGWIVSVSKIALRANHDLERGLK